MNSSENKSYSNYDHNGYPVLRLGYADVVLLGRWSGLANALFSLHKDQMFWVYYEDSSGKIFETYTLLDGVVEIEYEGTRRLLEIGETIDAANYEKIISVHGKTDAVMLIKMTAEDFETEFFETKILQREADLIDELDGYTYLHCNRIKDYSIELWSHLGLPIEKLNLLRWGAYFHDIGKRAVPLEILNKPGKLSANEWEIMKTHTTQGAKMMRDHPVERLKDAAFIVEQHHERHDGKGYPFGLKGDEISIEASIVSVVDAFDAMTTNRVYKVALTIKEAIEELNAEKGKQFNPEIVDAFLAILKKKQFKWK